MRRLVTILKPQHDANGRSLPITMTCVIKHKRRYLTEDGDYTEDLKKAVIIKKKSFAKQLIKDYKLKGQACNLTKEEIDLLWPQETEKTALES